jgi:peroxin-19
MMLSTEGMAAMGLNDKQSSSSSSKSKPSTSSASTGKKEATSTQTDGNSKADVSAFEETIRKAMESLNSAGGPSVPGAGGGGPSDPAELAKLLAQLGNDPNLDLEGDDELSGILDGMMGQLMTREVLEEPLSELASKVSLTSDQIKGDVLTIQYPEYLASPPKDLPSSELEKYRAQYALVQKIVDTFRKPGYSDDKDGKEIARLVGEMQDLGGPPGEIMGELPEGFVSIHSFIYYSRFSVSLTFSLLAPISPFSLLLLHFPAFSSNSKPTSLFPLYRTSSDN